MIALYDNVNELQRALFESEKIVRFFGHLENYGRKDVQTSKKSLKSQ